MRYYNTNCETIVYLRARRQIRLVGQMWLKEVTSILGRPERGRRTCLSGLLWEREYLEIEELLGFLKFLESEFLNRWNSKQKDQSQRSD